MASPAGSGLIGAIGGGGPTERAFASGAPALRAGARVLAGRDRLAFRRVPPRDRSRHRGRVDRADRIGADSLIEAVAGFVVVWLFTGSRIGSSHAERRAQQLIAVSFYVLAAYVGVESVRTLVSGDRPEASWFGIGLAAFTALTMPLLARAKRHVGTKLGSAAAVEEASQTSLCAYLSVALLVGLGANAVFGWWWADPLAALVIATVALKEGRKSWRGEGCAAGCC